MASGTEASQQANRAGMDPQRLVVGFYLVMAIVLALFFTQILSMVWARFGLPNTNVIPGPDWDVPTVLAVLLGVGLVVFSWVNKDIRGRALESATELMKVTWPTWGETRVATVAVVIASLVSALLLFVIDRLSYQIMVDWLPKLWGKL